MTEALPEAAVLGLPQVYEQGKGLPFHFDKDESLFKAQQEMVHPMLSSVLYLTGASAAPKRMGKPGACLWAASCPPAGRSVRVCSHREWLQHTEYVVVWQAQPSLWISSMTTGWAVPSLTPRSAAS